MSPPAFKSGMMKKILLSLLWLLAGAFAIAAQEQVPERPLSGNHGPYMIYTETGTRIVSMKDGEMSDVTYEKLPKKFRLSVSSNEGHNFEVALHKPIKHKQIQAQNTGREIFVVSDLHGRMDAFVALLKGNGVVDDSLTWSYGKNKLIFLGDALDRGRDDAVIVWLLYKLEAEAAKAGGEVIFMPGNHEDLVAKNDLRYVNKSNLRFAEATGIPYADMWGRDSELGRWIRQGHIISVVGRNLFVHAGLSPQLVEQEYSVAEMNVLGSQYLGYPNKERAAINQRNELLFGSYGTLWYRGMARDEERYNPITDDELDEVLCFYDVDRVFIGHSEVIEIESRYGGRVIAINVKHYDNFPANRTGAVVIKGSKLYSVDYTGKRTPLSLADSQASGNYTAF